MLSTHNMTGEGQKLADVELVTIASIIVVTILFEIIRGAVPRRVRKELLPVVESVFSELAILGFIGVRTPTPT